LRSSCDDDASVAPAAASSWLVVRMLGLGQQQHFVQPSRIQKLQFQRRHRALAGCFAASPLAVARNFCVDRLCYKCLWTRSFPTMWLVVSIISTIDVAVADVVAAV